VTTALRHLAFGVATAAITLWLMFFATFGTVEAATLVATVVTAIWAATVDPARLLDDRGRPVWALFALGAIGVAVIFTVAVLISTVTEYLALAVAVTAFVTALVRAIRYSIR